MFLAPPDDDLIRAIALRPEQARALVAVHRAALAQNGRIELDFTFPARFAKAFEDSPYLTDPANDLCELIELFHALRARLPAAVSDERILQKMRDEFDGRCAGSIALLADRLEGGLE